MNTNIIDITALENLKELFLEDFDQQFTTFIAYTEGYLNELEAALKSNSPKEASAIAHKLTSSTGQYGVVQLSRLAQQLERSSHEDILQNGSSMLEKMRMEFDTYKNFCRDNNLASPT